MSKTASVIKRGGKLVGNLVWIVTTSALLVGLPLALSLEDEAKIVAQEKEMLAQQAGAQQVCLSSFHFMLFFRPLLTVLFFSRSQMMGGYPAAPGSNEQKSVVMPGF